jgi:diguanylate cyclase (GGDEF)-like protein
MKPSPIQHARPTIALLVDGLIEDYEVKVWSGVCEAAKRQDLNLLCFASGSLDSPHFFSSQRNILLDLVESAVEAGQINGILALSGALGNFSTPQALLRTYARFSKVPLISIGAQFKDIPSITVDNAGGMREMIAHLIRDHGRRRIAFIRGPEQSDDAQERFEVYRQVLQENGIPFDPGLVAPGDFLMPSGQRAVALFMDERKVQFDALVAANDGMALDAMKALLARGVRIPEEIAVGGFDDAREGRNIIPALTSVRQPGKDLGIHAVGLIAEILRGQNVSEQNLLPTRLIHRESCGCIAAGKEDSASAKKAMKTSGALHDALPATLEECRASFPSISEALANERWLDELAGALIADIENDSATLSFLPLLRNMAFNSVEQGLDILIWSEFLYLLFDRLAPHIDSENPLPRMALLAMSQLTQATEVMRRMQYEEQTLLLYRAFQRMITSLNVETLCEIEGYTMPRLQIDSCHISTYVDAKVGPGGGMRPLVAFDRGRNSVMDSQGDFPASQILPGGLGRFDMRFSFAVYALFLEHDQIGYAVYDMSRNINSSIYEVLTGQLSSVLKSSSLLTEVRNYAKNLETLVQERTADLQKKTREVERLNEELIRKNKIDTLTSLYNRGAFFEYLQNEINRMRRLYEKLQQHIPIDASFCIMMIDIDHFKKINDSHGHLVGDRVLKQLGELLNSKNVFRREDTAGRFGGEEFIIVLINTNVQKALLPARRLMDQLAKIDFMSDDGRAFKVTVSIGISEYYPGDPSAETVIDRADKALYHAKETGRNRIVVYEEAFPMVKNKEDWNPSHNP